MQIISRKEASSLGATRYFTAKPCKNGHREERYVANSVCVQCNNDNFKKWSKKNSLKESARKKEYNNNNKDAKNAYFRNYCKNNRERINAINRKWHSLNYEKISISRKSWKENNREIYSITKKVIDARRRSIIQNCSGNHTAQDVREILVNQKHLCPSCGVSLRDGFHVDHIHPLSKGGGNDRSNLQCLCPPCNLSKGSMTMEEWKKRSGA